MLRGLLICPDQALALGFRAVLDEAGGVGLVRELDRHPSAVELMRLVRAHAPQIIFMSATSVGYMGEIVRTIEEETPGIYLVALSKTCEPETLLEAMRIGLREYLAAPFTREAVWSALQRAIESLKKRPPSIGATDQVFSFLPAKQGVGTTTVAVNTAMALANKGPGPHSGLLIDMDLSSGIVGFMLKLNNAHSVLEAAEKALDLDETLWPQLVSAKGQLDILHSGPLNPGFRIDNLQIRNILDFARRHYKAICVDLSGNLERYSMEVMHESKQVFLVITPEIPALHLAREKLAFLQQIDLWDRTYLLLNRSHRRALISNAQIESLLGKPIYAAFANDYNGVHRSLQEGATLDHGCELGKQFARFAEQITQKRTPELDTKKRFIDYFAILPKNFPEAERRSA